MFCDFPNIKSQNGLKNLMAFLPLQLARLVFILISLIKK